MRRRAAALARSRAVTTCALFVLVLAPMAYWLLRERAEQTSETWRNAYALAAAAPALGIAAAVLSLMTVLWRRSRPILRIDDQVRIRHSGVSFPLGELDTVQLWSREATYITLLPEHVGERVQDNARAVAPYSVKLPDDVTPRPFELAELIQQHRAGVRVDKIGSL